MQQLRSISVSALFCVTLAFTLSGSSRVVVAAPPAAPSNLQAATSGLNVALTWSGSAGSAYYILQAGYAPGQTAIQQPLAGSATSFNASAAPGTYYARIVAVNAQGEVSAPSNEVEVVLTNTCGPPSPPQNVRAIVRGTEVYVFWAQPAVGRVESYTLQAGLAPGATLYEFASTSPALNANATGTYYVRAIARNGCGASAASNEIEVVLPGNTIKVADPAPGTVLGLPDVRGLIAAIHNEAPSLITQSCPTGRKYENNPWLDRIVDRLRQYDTRFGYNSKPTRGPADNGGFPVIVAGDELTFFAGAGTAEGSRTVYALDILFNHCGTTPELTYRNFTGEEEAAWTGAVRFHGDRLEPEDR